MQSHRIIHYRDPIVRTHPTSDQTLSLPYTITGHWQGIAGAVLLVFNSCALADGAMDRCLTIESSVKRLACFEELTRSRQPVQEERVTEEQEPTPRPAPSPAETNAQPEQLPFLVTSHIVSVRRNTRYDPHVMTLANGEVWRENEANVQRIKSNQDVVITRGALNYSMRLQNGRTILVRKVR